MLGGVAACANSIGSADATPRDKAGAGVADIIADIQHIAESTVIASAHYTICAVREYAGTDIASGCGWCGV